MVNDEGFDVNFSNMTFFVFSNYVIEKDTFRNIIFYKSYCYKTLVGWYSNNYSRKGCFKAEKETENPNTLSFSKGKKINVNYTSSENRHFLEQMRFLAPNLETIKNKQTYLNQLKMAIKDWSLELYPEFLEMTVDELNNFSGINKGFNKKNTNSFRFKNKKMKSEMYKKKQSIKEFYDK